MHTSRRLALTAALAVGVAAGSYGVASAASGSGSSSSSSGLSGTLPSLSAQAPSQASPPSGQPWGRQRSDETLLTGDTKAKVEAAATAKLSGATIVRTETDADGHAKYEVHMVKADGTPATVYVDASFDALGVETGMPGGPGGPQQHGQA